MKEAVEFLGLLGYDPDNRVYLRGFSKQGGKAKKTSCRLSEFNYQELVNWKTSIYFVVNGGGHKDLDIKNCRAIFYEHDNLSKEQQKQLWKTLSLPEPTVQIDTGGKSIHSYWVFDKPLPVEKWKQLQTDLLEFSNGDRAIKNPSRVMRLPGFPHQDTGNLAQITSRSGRKYSYEELRKLIPQRNTLFPTSKIVNRKPSGIIFPACLFRHYGNQLALWLYCRYCDALGSGKAEIELEDCSQKLRVSVSTLRKWLCWENKLWRSYKTKNGKATIYYKSSHNLAAQMGLQSFDGGITEIEDISMIANHRLSIIATEIELQDLQKKSRYAANRAAIEKTANKFNLNLNESQHRKRLRKIAPKTLHPNDLVNNPAKKMARVLWKTESNLGVSEGFLSYGASQQKVADCRGLSTRQVQRHLSDRYRCSKSPVRKFRDIYPILGVQINQRLNRSRGQKADADLIATGKIWENEEGRFWERLPKIYEESLVIRKARFRRSRVAKTKIVAIASQ